MGLLSKIFSKSILKNITISFRKVERELNEHLDSINLNTNEIAYLYELLGKQDAKIDKLRDQLAEKKMDVQIHVDELTTSEKRVFICLYTHNEISYKEMSKNTKIPVPLVQEYVTNLIAKGVPVEKNYSGKDIIVSLDKAFKDLQTKKRIVKLV